MMDFKEEDVKELIHYQKKYGQRKSESWSSWVLKKRTINLACMVIRSVRGMDFADLEEKIYFRCERTELDRFQRLFEMQLENALLQPEQLVRDLFQFYMKTCLMIEEKHQYREFFDFYAELELQRRKKSAGSERVFDAYVSLVMQQAAFFSRNKLDYSVAGISRSGELIFRKNPHPYSDVGNYDLEKYFPDAMAGRRQLTPEMIQRAYRPYGYSFRRMEEIDKMEALVKVYDNNCHVMIPYINEQTLGIQIENPYQHYVPEFPRTWKSTEVYREKLLRRNYMLPVAGITVELKNAADIQKVFFMETLYNNQVVMLYRVSTYNNGEMSGLFLTGDQIFFSIFQFTNRPDWHNQLENFILELYMILTCDYEIDRKKNYAVRQVEQLDGEFYYPYQPLAVMSYKEKGTKQKSGKVRTYRKEEYTAELREREWFIRNLPSGQHASDMARQNAREKGYDLPEGKTFVQNFHYHVYRRINCP